MRVQQRLRRRHHHRCGRCRHTCSPPVVDAVSIARARIAAALRSGTQIWHLRATNVRPHKCIYHAACVRSPVRPPVHHSCVERNISTRTHTYPGPFSECIRDICIRDACILHAAAATAREGLKQPYCLRINQRGFHQNCTASDTHANTRIAVIMQHARCECGCGCSLANVRTVMSFCHE